MSNLSLVRKASVGVDECLTKSGAAPQAHHLTALGNLSALESLCGTASTVVARVQGPPRQALRNIVGLFRTKSARAPRAVRILDFKSRKRAGAACLCDAPMRVSF
jgi:hypothetical protein